MPKRMAFPQSCCRLSAAFFVLTLCSSAQDIVYSGREYLKVGRSWAQIREINLTTNQRLQLTASPRNHWHPWCAPDGRSVFFSSSSENGKEFLYRFDRFTKQEKASVGLNQKLFRITEAISNSRVIVEEYGGIIEIIDIRTNDKIRTLSGVHPALSPNHTLLAWQTPVDRVMHKEQRSHILMAGVDGSGQLDLGEGNTPVFESDGKALTFVRSQGERLDLVRYNIESQQQEIQSTTAEDADPFDDPYGLTISPDRTAIVLSRCCGRYGSAVFWRLTPQRRWEMIDDNLGAWGGWSQNGLMVYATDGRDLRPLDPKRGVWVGDVRLFDSLTGSTRTIVQGISQNEEPRWCTSASR